MSKDPLPGKLVFSKDGVHPLKAGRSLYQEIVSRYMLAKEFIGQTGEHVLPEPVEAMHFVSAGFLSTALANHSPGWEKVDAESDVVYTEDAFRTGAMLVEALKCYSVGESIDFEWEGALLYHHSPGQGHGR